MLLTLDCPPDPCPDPPPGLPVPVPARRAPPRRYRSCWHWRRSGRNPAAPAFRPCQGQSPRPQQAGTGPRGHHDGLLQYCAGPGTPCPHTTPSRTLDPHVTLSLACPIPMPSGPHPIPSLGRASLMQSCSHVPCHHAVCPCATHLHANLHPSPPSATLPCHLLPGTYRPCVTQPLGEPVPVTPCPSGVSSPCCVNHPGATLSSHPRATPPEAALPHCILFAVPSLQSLSSAHRPVPVPPHSGVTLSLSCTIPASSSSRVTSSRSHPIPVPPCSLATPSQCLPALRYSQASATPLQCPPVPVSPIPVPAAGPVGVPAALGGAVCGAGAVGGCGAVPAGRRRQ